MNEEAHVRQKSLVWDRYLIKIWKEEVVRVGKGVLAIFWRISIQDTQFGDDSG